MKFDRSGVSLYRQIADDLRSRIRDGEYKLDAALPPEQVLAQTYETTRRTIQEALRLLKSDGLIESQRGKGNFVVRVASANLPSSTEDLESDAIMMQMTDLVSTLQRLDERLSRVERELELRHDQGDTEDQ